MNPKAEFNALISDISSQGKYSLFACDYDEQNKLLQAYIAKQDPANVWDTIDTNINLPLMLINAIADNYYATSLLDEVRKVLLKNCGKEIDLELDAMDTGWVQS